MQRQGRNNSGHRQAQAAGLYWLLITKLLLVATVCPQLWAADVDIYVPTATQSRVIDAVRSGDLNKLRAIQSSDPEAIPTTRYIHEPQYPAEPQSTAPLLWFAIYRGNAAIVDFLIDAGCDPLERTAEGQSFAWAAIYADFGRAETLRILIQHGLDINAQDNNGDTVLHAAMFSVDFGSPGDPLTDLLAIGARADIRNFAGETPLAMYLNDYSINDIHANGFINEYKEIAPVYRASLPIPGWLQFLLWLATVLATWLAIRISIRHGLDPAHPELARLAAAVSTPGDIDDKAADVPILTADDAAEHRRHMAAHHRWRAFTWVPFIAGCGVTCWVILDPALSKVLATWVLYLYAMGYVGMYVMVHISAQFFHRHAAALLSLYSAVGAGLVCFQGLSWAEAFQEPGQNWMCYATGLLLAVQVVLLAKVAILEHRMLPVRLLMDAILACKDRIDFDHPPGWDESRQ